MMNIEKCNSCNNRILYVKLLRMEGRSIRKYHRITPQKNSQIEASEIMKCILMNTQLQVFSKTVMDSYKNVMAKQIVTAEQESIQQIRSVSPYPPYITSEDNKPVKGVFDTIRPYSAKMERVRKIESSLDVLHPSIKKRTSLARNIQSAKTVRATISIKPREDYRRQLSKYKSKIIPLLDNSEEDQECDKVIQQLRKNKLKAQQYERSKENFLNSIGKENEEYPKRKMKFASTMTRKDYTYEIPKVKNQMKKKSNTLKGTINSIGKKNENQEGQKPQLITVQFTKRQPRVELKEFIFNGAAQLKTQAICPANTYSTKYTVLLQDC